jgi:hypothetical protein
MNLQQKKCMASGHRGSDVKCRQMRKHTVNVR